MNGVNEGRGSQRERAGRPGRRGRGALSGRQRGSNSFRGNSVADQATSSTLTRAENGANGDPPSNINHDENETAEGKLERVESYKSDAGQEICLICASPVVHLSIAPCSHKTCHICSLRMRALYKSKACAHCRVRSVHGYCLSRGRHLPTLTCRPSRTL